MGERCAAPHKATNHRVIMSGAHPWHEKLTTRDFRDQDGYHRGRTTSRDTGTTEASCCRRSASRKARHAGGRPRDYEPSCDELTARGPTDVLPRAAGLRPARRPAYSRCVSSRAGFWSRTAHFLRRTMLATRLEGAQRKTSCARRTSGDTSVGAPAARPADTREDARRTTSRPATSSRLVVLRVASRVSRFARRRLAATRQPLWALCLRSVVRPLWML
jgi:hypothetical protein